MPWPTKTACASNCVSVCWVWLTPTKSSSHLKSTDLPAGGGAQRGIGLRLDAHQRDLLEVGAVVAGRFGAGQRELGGDVLGGDIAAALADAAAFQ